MNKHPNTLVLSHNCFSKAGSNGRTLANFFLNWPKESLAQFYISNEIPDSDVCENYFRVTDVEALKAIYKGAKVGKVIKKEEKSDENPDILLQNLYKKNRNRTSLNYIARNFIWDINRWRSTEFDNWLDEFNPDVIVLQLGDYAFMLRIALKLAKRKNIPLIIYNSEDYYFKNKKSLLPTYRFYRNDYKKQVNKLITYASCSIYNSQMLQQTYQSEFSHESTVIMASTDITPIENKKVNSPLIVSYLGNLGVGRHEPLIEIAEALHKLDSNLYLDIYGKAPNEDVEKVLRTCTSIRLKGLVSYDEVVKIMRTTDLLVHAENQSKFYQWDLKHAFSTKIADSLASGTCFFVYAPENMACTKYLEEKEATCVLTNSTRLKETLETLINDKELRQSFINNALRLVHDNHKIDVNADKFKELIFNVVKKESGTK